MGAGGAKTRDGVPTSPCAMKDRSDNARRGKGKDQSGGPAQEMLVLGDKILISMGDAEYGYELYTYSPPGLNNLISQPWKQWLLCPNE